MKTIKISEELLHSLLSLIYRNCKQEDIIEMEKILNKELKGQ